MKRALTVPGIVMIEVDQLTFRYRKTADPAISNLAFEIAKGEIFGFLGPSGAGKSTTQKVLIGLLPGYQGSVSLLGREVRNWDSSLYERIGVSFEYPNHFLKLTALENLRYFGRLYEQRTRSPRELLAQVGLSEAADIRVGEYSKGMRNRLSVARALLPESQLLFLDEPTAGLDPGNARRIRDLILNQAAAGKTIFLTTHDMAVADQLCDRVAFIARGKIELVDRPSDLKLRYGEATVRVEIEEDGGSNRQDFPLPGLGNDAAFWKLLREQRIRTIHTQEATLEEVFIRVTGEELS